MKSGRKPNAVARMRIELNAGRVYAYELAWLMGLSHRALAGMAKRMGVSLRVRKGLSA